MKIIYNKAFFTFNSPSLLAITAEAKQFPSTLIEVRPMSIRASTAKMTLALSGFNPSMSPTVPARITNEVVKK